MPSRRTDDGGTSQYAINGAVELDDLMDFDIEKLPIIKEAIKDPSLNAGAWTGADIESLGEEIGIVRSVGNRRLVMIEKALKATAAALGEAVPPPKPPTGAAGVSSKRTRDRRRSSQLSNAKNKKRRKKDDAEGEMSGGLPIAERLRKPDDAIRIRADEEKAKQFWEEVEPVFRKLQPDDLGLLAVDVPLADPILELPKLGNIFDTLPKQTKKSNRAAVEHARYEKMLAQAPVWKRLQSAMVPVSNNVPQPPPDPKLWTSLARVRDAPQGNLECGARLALNEFKLFDLKFEYEEVKRQDDPLSQELRWMQDHLQKTIKGSAKLRAPVRDLANKALESGSSELHAQVAAAARNLGTCMNKNGTVSAKVKLPDLKTKVENWNGLVDKLRTANTAQQQKQQQQKALALARAKAAAAAKGQTQSSGTPKSSSAASKGGKKSG